MSSITMSSTETARVSHPRPTTPAACAELWEELKRVAAEASTTYLEIIVNDSDPRRAHLYGGGLGSASLDIPNRGSFAKWALDQNLARKNTYQGGLTLFSYPRNGFPQTGQSEGHSVYIHKALRDLLADYGIKAELRSWSS